MISSDLPFPLSAESFNPVYITQPQKQYEFEMITFFTNNKNIDFEIKSVVDIIPDDDVEDLPIVERGTIELTFPDDDVEVIPDDDVSEDNKEIPDDETKIISEDDVYITPNDNEMDNISNDITITNDDQVNYLKIYGLAVLLTAMNTGKFYLIPQNRLQKRS